MTTALMDSPEDRRCICRHTRALHHSRSFGYCHGQNCNCRGFTDPTEIASERLLKSVADFLRQNQGIQE